MAVDGEGLGKEIGRVKEGAEIRKNKHALGNPITQPIPSKAWTWTASSALIITKNSGRGLGIPKVT